MAKMLLLGCLLSVVGPFMGHSGEPPRKPAAASLAAPWHQRERKLRPNSHPKKAGGTNNPAQPWRWMVQGESPNDLFGQVVAAAGDVNNDGFADVVICEPGFPNGGGKVCVYYGSSNGLPVRPDWTLVGQVEPRDQLLHAIGGNAEGVGDVNGDGFEDLVIVSKARGGTNLDAVNLNDEVRIYSGSPTGLLAEASWTFTADELGGISVVAAGRAGDLNGDGFADIYVLLSVDGLEPTNRHAIRILYGSPAGVRLAPDTTVVLDATDGSVHPVVACAGDVNRDGFDDLIVGQPNWSHTNHWRGRALLFQGAAAGLVKEPSWSAVYELPARKDIDENYEQCFGWSVAGAGDVNDDGFDDVIIGAPYADHDDLNEGLVFVYYGSPTGLSRQAKWFTESNHAHAWLGIAVSGAGDVNGDGAADVIMGAPQATDGQQEEGAVLAFLGSKHGLGNSPHWSVESDRSGEKMGRALAALGDVNGDGYDDIAIGSSGFSQGGSNNLGRVWVYYGSPNGLSGSFNWRISKPPLVALQQWWDHASVAWAVAALSGLMMLFFGSLIGWRRAVVRQRRAEREIARAQERERIARDIHDHLGANLSQIVLWSDLSQRIPELEQPADGAWLRVNQSAQSAIKYMRELVQTMTPSTASLAGFADHLADVAQQALEPTPLKLSLDFSEKFPDLQLSADARSNIAMMIKEALRNIIQHARATEVKFRLESPRQTLEITIEDDGQGFEIKSDEPAAAPNGNGGNGLRNLRSRTLGLGGQLKIDTRPGRGTTLRISLPLVRLRAGN